MIALGSTWLALGLASASAPLLAVEPHAPPPRRIEEQGESPYYYRRPKDTLGWGYRVGLGSRIALSSTAPRPRGRFTLDLLPELDVGLSRGSMAGVFIQGGYSFAREGLHLFVLGAGPAARGFGPSLGLGSRGQMTAALVGHGLVGTFQGERAGGVRTSVLFHVLAVGIEVGHQYLVAGSFRGHELRLTVALGLVGFGGGR